MHTLPVFRCQFPECSATYQRKEHLNRHAACHYQRCRFPCPYCNSTVGRRDSFTPSMITAQRLTTISDLLRRHVRKYHPEREPLPSRTIKACRACHARKERCDDGSPCSRCRQRKVTCSRAQQSPSPQGEPNLPETQVLLSADLAGPEPNMSRWPGEEFIDIYFREFHPVWPFLHRATFRPSREPCVLLQSMVMIGLWIKGRQKDRNMAMAFHQKLLSAIQSQRSQWDTPESTLRSREASWPMATYQSILLQLIFAVIVAKQEGTFDLNFRVQLSPMKFELLTSLVEACRRLGMFYYPNMLSQHSSSAPLALIWVSVEEIKRFGLALYKLCRLCACARDQGASRGGYNTAVPATKAGSLLTLAELNFCMPDSDELWNSPADTPAELFKSTALQHIRRDNRNLEEWISRAAGRLYDDRVEFDWV
ncbi:hypothetical protein BDV09DRAFT_206447 [Aspergillus tetrazonus]